MIELVERERDVLTCFGKQIALTIGSLSHVEIRIAQITPLTAEIIRYHIVQIVRQTWHSAEYIVRWHTEYMISITGRAEFGIV